MSAVASELGVSRNTLYRWIHEAKIDVDALRAELR
jgi:transposase-like protein